MPGLFGYEKSIDLNSISGLKDESSGMQPTFVSQLSIVGLRSNKSKMFAMATLALA